MTTNTPDDHEIGVLLNEAAHSIEASREVRAAVRERVLAEAKQGKELSQGRSKGGGNHRTLSVFLVRGGLAASVALAAVWLALSWSGSYANAAHALRSAAGVYDAYRGWIHVDVARDGQPVSTMHINTATGSFACTWYSPEGEAWMFEYDTPATGEQWGFVRGAEDIRVGSLPPSVLARHVREMAESSSFSRLIERLESYMGSESFTVRQPQEGAERFDFEWSGVEGGPDNQVTVLVDPQTDLVRKLTTVRAGNVTETTYRYGEPGPESIYDLGVPRETAVTVVDSPLVQTTPPVLTAQPATLNCEDLLAIVEQTRGSIRDLQVKFTFDGYGAGNLMNRSLSKVIVKGDKIYFDHQYSPELQGDSYRFHRTVAYNGRQSTLFEVSRGRAVISEGATLGWESQLKGKAFFDFNLLCPSRRRGTGWDDQSLLSLLRHGRVRDYLELVNGRVCHVVDVDGLTVWLDAERGCLVMRQVYHGSGDTAYPQMVFVTDAAAEVAPGFWLASKGRKIVNPRPGVPEIAGGMQRTLAVDGWASDQPSLRVNAGVDDALFDLWRDLPAGTQVWDQGQGRAWTVSAAEEEAH